MIHIYYGDGKGKTTAAIGLACRAAGSRMKVLFVQFLKTEFSGERHTLSHTENISLTFCPLELNFTYNMSEPEKAKASQLFRRIFDESVTKVLTQKYDMLVLDEIFPAIEAGMISESSVYEFVSNAPKNLEVVLTGRNPSEKILELADYITEMKKIRHPYDKGVQARFGIEF
ncbi:MAG: cob(I)yrinic acid a,c-diamide adenosyltransferase [Ruminococcus sp.]|nr:cob(I)yrinic acid a,c-diamide adenosyltransferase [Ruminococcus sp.]